MSAICGPATKVLRVDGAGVRWCFTCRARVAFTDTVHATVVASYWEPFCIRTCPEGHLDGDLFPGWSRSFE